MPEQAGIKVASVLEFLARGIFCFPKEKEALAADSSEEAQKLQFYYRILWWVAHGAALFDFVNFLLDFSFLITLFQEKQTMLACMLIIGMLMSWAVSYLGKVRLNEGGIRWAPFFIPYEDYYQNMPTRKAVMTFLNTIVFTELAAFLFEDGAFVVVFFWAPSEIRQDPSNVEYVNLWLTLVKAIISALVMLLAFLGSINLGWCQQQPGCCCKHPTRRSNARNEACLSVAWKMFKILIFLGMWTGFFWVFVVVISDLGLVIAGATGGYYWSEGFVLVYWSGGLYFAFNLMYYKKPPPETPAVAEETGIHKSSRALFRFQPPDDVSHQQQQQAPETPVDEEISTAVTSSSSVSVASFSSMC